MKTRNFIGKRISLEKLEELADEIYPPGEYDDFNLVAKLYLKNFEYQMTHKIRRKAYSIQMYIDNDKVLGIQRLGHCHLYGGGCSDDALLRFPYMKLEEESYNILTSLLL